MNSNLFLPWKSNAPPTDGKTILITDSIVTDGRFMLHILASQYLIQLQEESKIIWISCTSHDTEKQILDSINLHLNNKSVSNHNHMKLATKSENNVIEYISVASQLTSCSNADKNMKQILKDILTQTMFDQSETSDAVIIIDDLLFLQKVFGNQLTFGFLQTIRGKLMNRLNSALILRYPMEDHPIQSFSNYDTTSKSYVGADGHYFYADRSKSRNENFFLGLLNEMTDVFIDVLPLACGYYKDAISHGKIIFSQRSLQKLNEEESRKESQFCHEVVSFRYFDGGIRMNPITK